MKEIRIVLKRNWVEIVEVSSGSLLFAADWSLLEKTRFTDSLYTILNYYLDLLREDG